MEGEIHPSIHPPIIAVRVYVSFMAPHGSNPDLNKLPIKKNDTPASDHSATFCQLLKKHYSLIFLRLPFFSIFIKPKNTANNYCHCTATLVWQYSELQMEVIHHTGLGLSSSTQFWTSLIHILAYILWYQTSLMISNISNQCMSLITNSQ